MHPFLYPISLALISVFVAGLEKAFPYRKDQKQLRDGLVWDFVHLVFNAHFLGVIFYGVATTWLLPPFDQFLAERGIVDALYRSAAAQWPLWIQIPVSLVVIDFIQWCVHNALHRIPFLWPTHKCHHSVEDGEMDWIVSFRFQWTEVVVYKLVLFLPLAWFGFAIEAIMFHAIFGTLIGHLNHANLNITWGPLRYVFNSPNMHIWHHDYEGDSKTTKNFGIIFSTWDWIFGTAYLPDHPPAKLGFPGVEEFPKNFFAAEAWPLGQQVPQKSRTMAATAAGLLLLAGGWILHTPLANTGGGSGGTPMLGETQASSRPGSDVEAPLDPYSPQPAAAHAALQFFGAEATETGFEHPESMVSVAELALALGAPELVLLDVRPEERFSEGHIPSARQLYRSDYAQTEPISGVNRSAAELEALLERLGVSGDSVVVAYTDGGPEAYRLWWTLRGVVGFDIRVLDGGLQQWVGRGHAVAEGSGLEIAAGELSLSAGGNAVLDHWEDVQAFVERTDAQLLDTRSEGEFTGEIVKSSAARGGRIPGAILMEWWKIVRDVEEDHRLGAPDTLRATLEAVGLGPDRPIVTYCQSGTRSAGVYFAYYQLGASDDTTANYDGSWAEYSRLDLPAEP